MKGKQPRGRRGVHQSHGHGFESSVSYKSKGKVKLSPWDQILCGKDKNMQNPLHEEGSGEKR